MQLKKYHIVISTFLFLFVCQFSSAGGMLELDYSYPNFNELDDRYIQRSFTAFSNASTEEKFNRLWTYDYNFPLYYYMYYSALYNQHDKGLEKTLREVTSRRVNELVGQEDVLNELITLSMKYQAYRNKSDQFSFFPDSIPPEVTLVDSDYLEKSTTVSESEIEHIITKMKDEKLLPEDYAGMLILSPEDTERFQHFIDSINGPDKTFTVPDKIYYIIDFMADLEESNYKDFECYSSSVFFYACAKYWDIEASVCESYYYDGNYRFFSSIMHYSNLVKLDDGSYINVDYGMNRVGVFEATLQPLSPEQLILIDATIFKACLNTNVLLENYSLYSEHLTPTNIYRLIERNSSGKKSPRNEPIIEDLLVRYENSESENEKAHYAFLIAEFYRRVFGEEQEALSWHEKVLQYPDVTFHVTLKVLLDHCRNTNAKEKVLSIIDDYIKAEVLYTFIWSDNPSNERFDECLTAYLQGLAMKERYGGDISPHIEAIRLEAEKGEYGEALTEDSWNGVPALHIAGEAFLLKEYPLDYGITIPKYSMSERSVFTITPKTDFRYSTNAGRLTIPAASKLLLRQDASLQSIGGEQTALLDTEKGVIPLRKWIYFFSGGQIRQGTVAANCSITIGDNEYRLQADKQTEFHENGEIKSVYLESESSVTTPSGELPTDYIRFYEDGSIHGIELTQSREITVQNQTYRIDPSQGGSSIYFYKDGVVESIDATEDSSVTVGENIYNPKGIRFNNDGTIRSLRLRNNAEITTVVGNLLVDAVYFYSDGTIKSLSLPRNQTIHYQNKTYEVSAGHDYSDIGFHKDSTISYMWVTSGTLVDTSVGTLPVRYIQFYDNGVLHFALLAEDTEVMHNSKIYHVFAGKNKYADIEFHRNGELRNLNLLRNARINHEGNTFTAWAHPDASADIRFHENGQVSSFCLAYNATITYENQQYPLGADRNRMYDVRFREDGTLQNLRTAKAVHLNYTGELLTLRARENEYFNVSFFDNGNIQTLVLPQKEQLSTPLGILSVKSLDFYENGAFQTLGLVETAVIRHQGIKYNLFGSKNIFPAVQFHQSGGISEVWVNEPVALPTSTGTLKAISPIQFYEDGNIESAIIEPKTVVLPDGSTGDVTYVRFHHNSRGIESVRLKDPLTVLTSSGEELKISSAWYDQDGRLAKVLLESPVTVMMDGNEKALKASDIAHFNDAMDIVRIE